MTENNINLVINKMTKAKYEELLNANQLIDTELYYIIDDNDRYYLKNEVYTQEEVNNLLLNKANTATTLAGYGIDDAYTKTQVNELVSSVYKYKGSKPNKESLPVDGNIIGDVWNVEDTDKNYAWNGTGWDDLGGIQNINLDDYYTQTQVNNLVSPKADKSYVDEQLALKDTIVSVDEKLSTKANTTFVNEELGKKQNTLSEEQLTNISNVPNKADTTAVNDQLALKQNELIYADALPETATEGDIYLVPGAGGGGGSGGGGIEVILDHDEDLPDGTSKHIDFNGYKIIFISLGSPGKDKIVNCFITPTNGTSETHIVAAHEDAWQVWAKDITNTGFNLLAYNQNTIICGIYGLK